MSVYYPRTEAVTPPDGDHAFDLQTQDPSWSEDAASMEHVFWLSTAELDRLFFSPCGLGYISDYFRSRRLELRVVTHPRSTNTCFEKAQLIRPWSALNVIKALYFEDSGNGLLYAAVVPETGCFLHRGSLAKAFEIDDPSRLQKANILPKQMEFGTCSPFIREDDLYARGGAVAKILYDSETLLSKKKDAQLDDFSFGLNHRASLQLSYFHSYKMLAERYPDVVDDAELLPLSCKEVLVRNRGKLKVTYEFESVSYRIATFINGAHGAGDITIINDQVDELDLPDVLRQRRDNNKVAT